MVFKTGVSLVQSVAPRRTRAEIICLRVDLLALGGHLMHAKEMIDVHRNSRYVQTVSAVKLA